MTFLYDLSDSIGNEVHVSKRSWSLKFIGAMQHKALPEELQENGKEVEDEENKEETEEE